MIRLQVIDGTGAIEREALFAEMLHQVEIGLDIVAKVGGDIASLLPFSRQRPYQSEPYRIELDRLTPSAC